MLSRMVNSRPVVLQWSLVQVDGGRLLKPPSLAVALADLRNDIIGIQDRREGDDTKHPEDFIELAQLEDQLRRMLGEDAFEEFRDLGLPASWRSA